MKQKRIAAYLCTAILLTVTGCGNTDVGQSAQTADTTRENVQTDENVNADSGSQQDVSEENDSNFESDGGDTVSEEPVDRQAETALDGIVVSVGDNSVVVSEMIMESAEDNGVTLVREASQGEDIILET